MQYINRKPPAGAKINWTHPLTQKLVACWLFNERGYRINDLAGYKLKNLSVVNFSSPVDFATTGLMYDGSNDTNCPANVWTQIGYVLKNSKHIFYKNGIINASSASTNVPPCLYLATTRTCIGNEYATALRYFTGRIGLIRVWNGHGLSSEEMKQIYQNPYDMFI